MRVSLYHARGNRVRHRKRTFPSLRSCFISSRETRIKRAHVFTFLAVDKSGIRYEVVGREGMLGTERGVPSQVECLLYTDRVAGKKK
ncbi:hypothetical protein ANTPLA_LOCUS3502 [Anthophora plagiata]